MSQSGLQFLAYPPSRGPLRSIDGNRYQWLPHDVRWLGHPRVTSRLVVLDLHDLDGRAVHDRCAASLERSPEFLAAPSGGDPDRESG